MRPVAPMDAAGAASIADMDLSDQSLQELNLPKDVADDTLGITSLDASRNKLTSLLAPATQPLRSLQQLSLARNRLQDVSGLALLRQLRVLNLSRNNVQDLQPLQALTRLEQLDLHSNRLSSLAPISALPLLTSLNAAANQLTQLPSLAGLTRLSELNLRHNLISQLTGADLAVAAPGAQAPSARQDPAAAAGAGAGAGSAGASSSSKTSSTSGGQQGLVLLPSSLQRLSLACNQLDDVASLAVLRQLPVLADLCVDGNPFTAAARNPHPAAAAAAAALAASCGSSYNSSSSCWYREAVLLAACTPSLLRLDGTAVSPAERALLLTSAAALHASCRTQHTQQLSAVLTATHISTPQTGTLGTASPPAAAAAAASSLHGLGAEGIRVQEEQADPHAGGTAAAAAATAVATSEQQAAAVAKAIAAALAAEATTAEAATRSNACDSSSSSSAQEVTTYCQQQDQQQHKQQPRPVLSSPDQPVAGQQQQEVVYHGGRLYYQGSLKAAAISCGIQQPEPGPGADGAGVAGSSNGSSRTAAAGSQNATTAGPAAATGGGAAGAGSAGRGGDGGGMVSEIPGVFLSDAEVEEYLQVEKARLLARTKAGPPAPSPPAATPGMELVGSRCVLTGSVLHLLAGDGLAAVSDLTLAHVAYAEVLAALPSLLALRRLRHLSLVSTRGLATLPQLHPLLQLRRLSALSLQDCPVCSLALLRPYVAFRFPSLQSFNGTAVSADEVAAAARLFGVLEGALDAALDEAPQQAALAAAGVQPRGPSSIQQSRPGADTATAAGGTSATGSGSAWLSPPPPAARISAARPAGSSSGCSSRVSQVLAAMQGPLLPPAAVVEQGRQFARQVLCEAAAVQQQLAEFEEVTWPALLEGAIQQAWLGHPAAV